MPFDDNHVPAPLPRELSGPFIGELHGTVFPDGTDMPGRPVTLGVVVCPACASLVFTEGYDAHMARHNTISR